MLLGRAVWYCREDNMKGQVGGMLGIWGTIALSLAFIGLTIALLDFFIDGKVDLFGLFP
jgi:hypothetical protein